MSDDVFRMIVAGGVVLAALAFVTQALVGIATLGAARKMQAKVAALADRAEPLLNKAGPTLEKAGATLEKAAAAIEKVGPLLDKAGPLLDKAGAGIEQAKTAGAQNQPAPQKGSGRVGPP